MNNFTFETQGTHTYLVYSVGNEVLDNMSVGMLTGNNIDGFLTTAITQLDANKFIKYDVSAKLSAKEFLSGYVTRKRLLGVFSGVVRALFSAEEYMLDPASVLLDLDYMYSDVATGETWLICLPVVNTDTLPVQPANFFKSVISNIQCDPTENCDYFAKILNYLNGAAIFSLEDFGELLSALAKENTTPPAYGSAPVNRAPQTSAAPAKAQPQQVQPPVAPVQPQAQPQPQPQRPMTPPPAPQARPAVPVQPQRPVTPPPAPQARPAAPAQPQANNAASEKDMSWFYLMQHYNAENAATYKAQKEAKKNKGSVAPVQSAPQTSANTGFAIPGQSAPAPAQPVQRPAAPAQPQRPMTPPPAPQARPAAPAQPQRPVTPPPAPQARPAAPAQPQRPVTPPPAPQARPAAPTGGAPMNFGETVVVDSPEMNGTVVIGATVNQVKAPCLIRVKTKEKISLTKPVVRLGRARDFVDYCIHDNPAVSQSHANIFNRGGTCFIVDTNSTNHTYVNGTMLSVGAEVQLNEGDKIRLGNEEFDFKLC